MFNVYGLLMFVYGFSIIWRTLFMGDTKSQSIDYYYTRYKKINNNNDFNIK